MELVTGHAGTDHISAADMAALYRGLLIQDDVVLDSGNKLACTMLDANTAEIDTGDCMLQAHHARVDVAEQLEVRSGSNGYNRNDLIVARYTLGTGNVQSIYLAVVEGTATAGEADDPTYTTGSIDGGTTLIEFPLWRIPITGVNVGTPERIMPTVDNFSSRIGALEALTSTTTTVTSGIFTHASGITVESQKFTSYEKIAMLELQIKHSSAWTVGTQYNIGTVADAYKPIQNICGMAGSCGGALLLDTGSVYVRPLYAAEIAANSVTYVRFVYLVP